MCVYCFFFLSLKTFCFYCLKLYKPLVLKSFIYPSLRWCATTYRSGLRLTPRRSCRLLWTPWGGKRGNSLFVKLPPTMASLNQLYPDICTKKHIHLTAGHSKALSTIEEACIALYLKTVSDWGFPFSTSDIQFLVSMFLKKYW